MPNHAKSRLSAACVSCVIAAAGLLTAMLGSTAFAATTSTSTAALTLPAVGSFAYQTQEGQVGTATSPPAPPPSVAPDTYPAPGGGRKLQWQFGCGVR